MSKSERDSWLSDLEDLTATAQRIRDRCNSALAHQLFSRRETALAEKIADDAEKLRDFMWGALHAR